MIKVVNKPVSGDNSIPPPKQEGKSKKNNASILSQDAFQQSQVVKKQEPINPGSLTRTPFSDIISSVVQTITGVYRYYFTTTDLPKKSENPLPTKNRVIPHFQQTSRPAGIPNTMNSCYRISSNQALRVFQPLVGALRKECVRNSVETDEKYNGREMVRQALVYLIDCLEEHRDVEEIYLADVTLALAVASTGLSPDLQMDNVSHQQDAAAYVELILGIILNDLHVGVVDRRGRQADGSEFSRPLAERPKGTYAMFQIPIQENCDQLQKLVDAFFELHEESHPESPWKPEKGLSFDKYTVQTVLTTEPKPILAIQLKRAILDQDAFQDNFNLYRDTAVAGMGRELTTGEEMAMREQLSQLYTQGIVDERPIKFPAGDILDFSKAYDKTAETVKYGLKSFVCHLGGGSSGSGHYVSYVNKNGQWYYCNDNSVAPVSQTIVDKAKVKAYLIFFERLKDKV